MSLLNNIDFEIKSTGLALTGSAFNSSNPGSGLNYSYGNDYNIFSYDDLEFNNYDAPDAPSYTIASGSGTLTAGSYYLGIRFISFNLDNSIQGTSQLTEILISISNNDRIDVASPADLIYPFTHYQITLRPSAGSIAYFQQNSGGPNLYVDYTEQFFVQSYYNAGANLSSLPFKGNIYKLSSIDRPFISDDIGNYILIENNHIGFRSLSSTSGSLLNSPAIELCKTTNDPIAAWFDISGSTKVVKRISAAMWAVGSPSGDLFFELRPDNSGVPSNTVLGMGGINASTLTSTASWVDISVNVSCAPGRYWIVIYLDNSPSAVNYIRIKRANGVLGINNEHLYTYNSGTSTWTSSNDNYAVAIDASWNSEDWWTWGNNTNFIENNGNLRFEILNVNSGDALIYETSGYVANPGSIGGLGHLGGADSSILRVFESINLQHETSGSNNLYLKNSTYVIDQVLEINNPLHIHGYENTHEDFSENRPIIQLDPLADPTNFLFAASGMIYCNADHIELTNIEVDGSAIAEKLLMVNDNNIYIQNCVFYNSENNAIYISGNTNCVVVIDSCMIKDITNTNSSASGIFLQSGTSLDISHSYFKNIIGSGVISIDVSFSAQYCIFENINGSTSYLGIGIRVENAPSSHIHYCTFHDIERTGLNIYGEGHFFITNNIFSTCGNSAVFIDPLTNTSFGLQKIDSNSFYNNIPNNVMNNNVSSSGTRSFSISGTPFANAATGDFRLNSNLGAGYNLIGKANPQKFVDTSLPQKMDVGAAQTYGNTPVPRRNPTISFV